MVQRVYLVGNGDREGISLLAETLNRIIAARPDADLVGTDFTCLRDLSRIKADLVVVLGGDGTILGTARRMGSNQIPVLGINAGHLGFLSCLLEVDMERALDAALAGDLVEQRRLMIRGSVLPGTSQKVKWKGLALNDGVLLRNRDHGLLTVDVWVGGTFVSSYSGDGVVISTAGGSTAYCLSAGGPILMPDMDTLVVVPLSCHSLALRPLVVHAREGVEMRINEHSKSGTGTFVIDGQVSCEIAMGERIKIKPARQKFRLLTSPKVGFFKVLKEKLGWSGHPQYRK